MTRGSRAWFVAAMAAAAIAPALVETRGAEIRVDLKKETPGKPPQTFEPMVGTWIVAQDGPDKVIMVDGRPWVGIAASATD